MKEIDLDLLMSKDKIMHPVIVSHILNDQHLPKKNLEKILTQYEKAEGPFR